MRQHSFFGHVEYACTHHTIISQFASSWELAHVQKLTLKHDRVKQIGILISNYNCLFWLIVLGSFKSSWSCTGLVIDRPLRMGCISFPTTPTAALLNVPWGLLMSLLQLSVMLFQDWFKLEPISLVLLASCILQQIIKTIVSSKILSRLILRRGDVHRTTYWVAYKGEAWGGLKSQQICCTWRAPRCWGWPHPSRRVIHPRTDTWVGLPIAAHSCWPHSS